jgi:hypothetical protein
VADKKTAGRKLKLIPNPVLAPFAGFPQEQAGTVTVVDTQGKTASEAAAMIPGARLVRGPGQDAIILAPEPGEIEAWEQVEMAMTLLRAALKEAPPVATSVLDALYENFKWLVNTKDAELLKSTAKALELQAILRSREHARRGKLRTQVNQAAKAKADAKAAAQKLWNQWMDTKPRHTWTNEQFARHACETWPQELPSLLTVIGWCTSWKKSRRDNSSQLAD